MWVPIWWSVSEWRLWSLNACCSAQFVHWSVGSIACRRCRVWWNNLHSSRRLPICRLVDWNHHPALDVLNKVTCKCDEPTRNPRTIAEPGAPRLSSVVDGSRKRVDNHSRWKLGARLFPINSWVDSFLWRNGSPRHASGTLLVCAIGFWFSRHNHRTPCKKTDSGNTF